MNALTEDERADIYRLSASLHDGIVRTERAMLEKNAGHRGGRPMTRPSEAEVRLAIPLIEMTRAALENWQAGGVRVYDGLEEDIARQIQQLRDALAALSTPPLPSAPERELVAKAKHYAGRLDAGEERSVIFDLCAIVERGATVEAVLCGNCGGTYHRGVDEESHGRDVCGRRYRDGRDGRPYMKGGPRADD